MVAIMSFRSTVSLRQSLWFFYYFITYTFLLIGASNLINTLKNITRDFKSLKFAFNY
jgi:hypothetical protein